MNENLRKYNSSFIESFNLTEDKLGLDLIYNSVIEWDSVGHMTLISAIEDAFGITMDTEDIINFSSYDKGKEILSKYSVEV